MTPQDSQRLLSLLNASFKQQLDRQHQDASSSSEHNADLHLQSILTDPLFAHKVRTPDNSYTKSQNPLQCVGQPQKRIKQPIDLFKERVSQGKADLETAKSCLRAQRTIDFSRELAKRRKGMRSSETVSTLLQWLWSSGAEEPGQFLRDKDFIDLFVPYLIVEGRQPLILRWLQRYETPSTSLHKTDARCKGFLFFNLIACENRYGDGLKSAIRLFVRSIDIMYSCGWNREVITSSIMSAAWLLTRRILQHPGKVELEPSSAQALLNILESIDPHHLATAHLYLLIPEQPDPRPASAYLERLSSNSPVMVTYKHRPYILLLGLKAAQVLVQNNHQKEALRIMDFLNTNFAQDLGQPSPQVLEPGSSDVVEVIKKDEKRNLILLDQLAIQ